MKDDISYINYVKRKQRDETVVTIELFGSPVDLVDNMINLVDVRKAYFRASVEEPGKRAKAIDQWRKSENAIDLIEYLEENFKDFGYSDVNQVIYATRGTGGGTYVCKEIAYSYAMWCDARFAAYVLNAFSNIVDHNFKGAYLATTKVAKTFVKLEWEARAERFESKGMDPVEYFSLLISDVYFRVTNTALDNPLDLRNYVYKNIGDSLILERILNALELLWEYEDADTACKAAVETYSTDPEFEKLVIVMEEYRESNDIPWK